MVVPRDELDEGEWADALARAECLRRLPERPSLGEVADAMAELGISRSTLFRW